MFLQSFLLKYISGEQTPAISRKNVAIEALALQVMKSAHALTCPLMVTLPEAKSCDALLTDLEFWYRYLGIKDKRLLYLPECGRGKLLFPGGESRRARALDLLLDGRFDIAIGSVHALMGPAPVPGESEKAKITLKRGMTIPIPELVKKLVALDYDDEFEASVPGEFARRGGLIDIYSPAHDLPCRIEFFGDTIDSIRFFSPQDQRSTGAADHYDVIGRAGITAGGRASADATNYLERYNYHLLSIHPEQSGATLERYLDKNTSERFRALLDKKMLADKATVFLDPAESISYREIVAEGEIFPRHTQERNSDPAIQQQQEEMLAQALAVEMENFSKNGHCVVSAKDKLALPELRQFCRTTLKLKKAPEYEVLDISTGFRIGNELEIITEEELASAGFRRRSGTDDDAPAPEELVAQNANTLQLKDIRLADLDIGDYAVHLDYGIGIFRGLKTIKSNGVSREMLAVEYQDGQILNVPLMQAHKLSRYLGSPGKVKLHSLTTSHWSKDKEKARSGVHAYAADMLRMQALRKTLPGIKFPPDGSAMKSFVGAFPFKDTPDQTISAAEIGKDMCADRPMDRLLCGDVGYGKTEIAMRAAFRAVNAGYQVALLAPTTVLANQHLRSFESRFAEYPFNIAVLTRFQTEKEQKKISDDLQRGVVDIVIGTHRLCSERIKFHNLGLVIIDEEQRFGVEHKERLRRFRAEADVLTMSATPIPRTLYLAMAGARDLSTLMTAPKMRMPIKTVVAPREDDIVATAIKAELARGGQLYYLHNRINTINECAEKLRKLVPDARIAVSHGRMPEAELEKNMNLFVAGKIDCLVCSTIIESGLDVPNANTIIIERADRFGLAQLYQLRGRVGRWTRQAYAYLLLERNQFIGSDAKRRLNAICRCTKLGSGMQLALHDLEIRGAGNLLGAEQSGHINAIGFDLYCKLLQQEIALLGGTKKVFLPEVEVAIDFVSFSLNAAPGQLAAAIPAEYIGGERLRIDAYRKLAEITSEAELQDFRDEMIDRFGKMPEETANLIEVMRIKLLVARAGYRIFSVVDGRVIIRNVGGTIYRDDSGSAPRLDYRDAPKLRLKHLLEIVRKI